MPGAAARNSLIRIEDATVPDDPLAGDKDGAHVLAAAKKTDERTGSRIGP